MSGWCSCPAASMHCCTAWVSCPNSWISRKYSSAFWLSFWGWGVGRERVPEMWHHDGEHPHICPQFLSYSSNGLSWRGCRGRTQTRSAHSVYLKRSDIPPTAYQPTIASENPQDPLIVALTCAWAGDSRGSLPLPITTRRTPSQPSLVSCLDPSLHRWHPVVPIRGRRKVY